VNSNQLNQTM